MADVQVTIRDVLDELPADPYPKEMYDAKVQAIFDHVYTSYGDDASSVYDFEPAGASAEAAPASVAVDDLTDSIVERIRRDREFAALVARQLRGGPAFARTIDELLASDEDDTVEFKSTARWDVRERSREARPLRTPSSRPSPRFSIPTGGRFLSACHLMVQSSDSLRTTRT